jgi:hypothetical protein
VIALFTGNRQSLGSVTALARAEEHRHPALSTESQSVPREEDAVVLVSDLRKQAG